MKRNERRKFIKELFKLVDTNSILVIKGWNTLKRFHCPFKVKAIRDVGGLKMNVLYEVDSVKIDEKTLKEVFIIHGQAYYISHFKIFPFQE